MTIDDFNKMTKPEKKAFVRKEANFAFDKAVADLNGNYYAGVIVRNIDISSDYILKDIPMLQIIKSLPYKLYLKYKAMAQEVLDQRWESHRRKYDALRNIAKMDALLTAE